jgi:hypothetical protein
VASQTARSVAAQRLTITSTRVPASHSGRWRAITALCWQRRSTGSRAATFENDGELVHVRASHNIEAVIAPGSSCRAILDRQIIYIRDMQAEADLLGTIRSLGNRSQVSVPMRRDRTQYRSALGRLGASQIVKSSCSGHSPSRRSSPAPTPRHIAHYKAEQLIFRSRSNTRPLPATLLASHLITRLLPGRLGIGLIVVSGERNAA